MSAARSRGALLTLLACTGCFDVVQHGVPWTLERTPACRAEDTVTATSWKLRIHASDGGVDERTFSTFPDVLGLEPADDVFLRLEALQGDTVVGRATSTHFATGDGGVVPLTILPVGRFVQSCATLTLARSGHTATQLRDGTVLIGGGLSAGQALSSLERLDAQRSAEVGQLGIRVAGMRYVLPRAFHSAVRLTNGQVVFAGGESRSAGAVAPTSSILFVEPLQDFEQGAVGGATWTSRTRHTAMLTPDALLFAGGLTRTPSDLEPTTALDRLELASNRFLPPTQLPRAHDEAAMAFSPDALVIAGGATAGLAQQTLHLVFFNGSLGTSSLLEAKRDATAARVGNDVLVISGFDASNTLSTTSEWVRFSGLREAGPTVFARRHACSTTLSSGAALVLGGFDAPGVPTRVVEWFHPDGSMTVDTFPGEGRVDATCTTLDDGSVLIVGGRSASGELSDVWRYVPR